MRQKTKIHHTNNSLCSLNRIKSQYKSSKISNHRILWNDTHDEIKTARKSLVNNVNLKERQHKQPAKPTFRLT